MNDLSKSCLNCQKSKVHRHVKLAQNSNTYIQVDLVRPMPISDGFSYILRIIDRCTRRPEVYSIKDMTTSILAKTFICQFVSRFEVPLTMTTDQGTQFKPTLFCELNKFFGTHRARTTAYQPQAQLNGIVERFHR